MIDLLIIAQVFVTVISTSNTHAESFNLQRFYYLLPISSNSIYSDNHSLLYSSNNPDSSPGILFLNSTAHILQLELSSSGQVKLISLSRTSSLLITSCQLILTHPSYVPFSTLGRLTISHLTFRRYPLSVSPWTLVEADPNNPIWPHETRSVSSSVVSATAMSLSDVELPQRESTFVSSGHAALQSLKGCVFHNVTTSPTVLL